MWFSSSRKKSEAKEAEWNRRMADGRDALVSAAAQCAQIAEDVMTSVRREKEAEISGPIIFVTDNTEII